MSNKRTIQLSWTTVYADSTTVRFLPDAALMETAGLEQVRVTWELEQATSANLRVEPAYRLGNSIDTMDSTSSELWTGGPLGTGGVHYPGGWIVVATPVADRQVLQLGWEVSLSTGSGLACARVRARVELVYG